MKKMQTANKSKLLQITWLTLTLFLLTGLSTQIYAQTEWKISAKGSLRRYINNNVSYIKNGSFKIVTPGWRKVIPLSKANIETVQLTDYEDIFKGVILLDDNEKIHFVQTVVKNVDNVKFNFEISTETGATIEGIYYSFDLPVSEFAGGSVRFYKVDQDVKQTTFPPRFKKRDFLIDSGEAEYIKFTDISSAVEIKLENAEKRYVQIQDERKWEKDYYKVLITAMYGALKKGHKANFSFTITAKDRGYSKISLFDGYNPLHFDGFGGNYCFGILSKETEFTLKHLDVRWARVEMTLRSWEPRNDDNNPFVTNWSFFKKRLKKSKVLSKELEFATRLHKRGIPLCISIWNLPPWLYEDSEITDRNRTKRRVPRKNWDEMFECIISYLLSAKKYYGLEIDLFSFNEPDIGINVLFTPEEYAEMIQRLGILFQNYNLKTKILLGDVSNPRDTWSYIDPVFEVPENLEHIGAIGFHSWGDANADQYKHWRTLASKHELPLLVTELGVDPDAWKTKTFNTWPYAFQEISVYMKLMSYSKPQGIMQWQFTPDYSLFIKDKKDSIKPWLRYFFIKQLCNLTPEYCFYMESVSDHPNIYVVSLKTEDDISIHILNAGPAQTLKIENIPEKVDILSGIATSEKEFYKKLGDFTILKNHSLKFLMPEMSLVTLTTMKLD